MIMKRKLKKDIETSKNEMKEKEKHAARSIERSKRNIIATSKSIERDFTSVYMFFPDSKEENQQGQLKIWRVLAKTPGSDVQGRRIKKGSGRKN